MVSQTRFLIINADDFGYNDAITQGILKGFSEGLITSTSAMVNISGAPKRIAAAHASQPDLPIGLHINLTAGRPVLPPQQIPHLVDSNGVFLSYQTILPYLTEIPLDEIRSEVFAQAWLLNQCGIAFDHIDYHQHILALSPSLFEVAVELGSANHVPVRQPILKIVPGRYKVSGIHNFNKIVKGMVRAFWRNPQSMARFLALIYSYRHLNLAAARIDTPDWFISAFFSDPTLENFCAILRQLPPGLSELVTHPALNAAELYTMEEDYRAERPLELAVLLDPRARAEVVRQGIRLVDFSAARRLVSSAS